MPFTIAIILLIAWGFLYIARGAWLGMTGTMIEQGNEIPMSFTVRRVAVPAGDDFVLGLGTSVWRVPDGSLPPGGGAAPVHAPVTRVGYKVGRSEFWLGPGRIERRIDGRTRVDSGTLTITKQRLAFRGKREKIDVLLGDIAGMDVRGPLLELRRRSRPNDPVAFKLSQAVLVAKVVQGLAARARVPAP